MQPTGVVSLVAMLLVGGATDTVAPATSAPRAFDLDSTDSTYPFVMLLHGTVELRGDTLLVEVRSVMVRSAIRPSFWGQGLATEAGHAVLSYAFATLRLQEVVADVDECNAGSIRVLGKLGMSLQRRSLVKDRCLLYYGVSREATSGPQLDEATGDSEVRERRR